MYFKYLIFVAFCILTIEAYMSKIGPTKSECPGHPDHCHDKKYDQFYKPSDEAYQRIGACERIYCHADFSMDVHGCGPRENDCEELEVDKSLPYPNCCPKFKCSDGAIHAESALMLYRPSVSPDKPGYCFYSDTHEFFKPSEETYTPKGICLGIRCNEDFSMQGSTCEYPAQGDCEKLPVDNSLPYPDCCPEYKCKDGEPIQING